MRSVDGRPHVRLRPGYTASQIAEPDVTVTLTGRIHGEEVELGIILRQERSRLKIRCIDVWTEILGGTPLRSSPVGDPDIRSSQPPDAVRDEYHKRAILRQNRIPIVVESVDSITEIEGGVPMQECKQESAPSQ